MKKIFECVWKWMQPMTAADARTREGDGGAIGADCGAICAEVSQPYTAAEVVAVKRYKREYEACPYSRHESGCCQYAHVSMNGRHLCFWLDSDYDVTGKDIVCPMMHERHKKEARLMKFVKAEKKRQMHEEKLAKLNEQIALTEGDMGTKFA